MKCWSCGSTQPWCYEGCECAKCVDPGAYADWKNNCPDEYEAWIDRQLNGDEVAY